MLGSDSGFAARVKAVLGPTNTGKTHLAIERLLAHSSGIIGFPLRLLARENYDRMVAIKTDVVKLFLDSWQVPLRTNAGHAPMSAAAIGEAARRFTVKIECLR